MIKADKQAWFQSMLHAYNKYWLLRRNFYTVHLNGRVPETDRPILLIANHSSWWDGLISFYLSEQHIKHDCYAMMGEDGLKEFPFFRKIGAFSVNPNNPRSLLQSLRYGKDKLARNQAVWMFPQGAEQHLEKRPLDFMGGVAYLLEDRPDVLVVPVTYYYTFMHEQQPELFIQIGTAIEHSDLGADRTSKTVYLETYITKQLDHQKERLIQGNIEDYQPVITGRRTVSEWLQSYRTNRRNE
ncbi:lysophospholipid acyltransferase family protein [Bacillus sp. FJAT-45037]|uniref:lysophospholipid acyltransferase family protein n=1 Tax=Bacillus sp. FJAT-45037 TaxID=2011007 RepID=UPI000C2503DF|nr:lysophospholipid acyltransferase family protein [Bacillus sp. FJAT-45037]